MPPAAGAVAQSNRAMLMSNVTSSVVQTPPAMVSDSFAKDAVIAWFRGEFAAANAIIDALCNHLTQLEGGAGSEYESVFTAIHRRRLNWIPILQMQKYYSIADVALELRKVAARKAEAVAAAAAAKQSVVVEMKTKICHASREEPVEITENGGGEVVDEESIRDDSHGSPESEITDSVNQSVVDSIKVQSIVDRIREVETVVEHFLFRSTFPFPK